MGPRYRPLDGAARGRNFYGAPAKPQPPHGT